MQKFRKFVQVVPEKNWTEINLQDPYFVGITNVKIKSFLCQLLQMMLQYPQTLHISGEWGICTKLLMYTITNQILQKIQYLKIHSKFDSIIIFVLMSF